MKTNKSDQTQRVKRNQRKEEEYIGRLNVGCVGLCEKVKERIEQIGQKKCVGGEKVWKCWYMIKTVFIF